MDNGYWRLIAPVNVLRECMVLAAKVEKIRVVDNLGMNIYHFLSQNFPQRAGKGHENRIHQTILYSKI